MPEFVRLIYAFLKNKKFLFSVFPFCGILTYKGQGRNERGTNAVIEEIVEEILDYFGLGPNDIASFLLPHNYYFSLYSLLYFGDIDPISSRVHWRANKGF